MVALGFVRISEIMENKALEDIMNTEHLQTVYTYDTPEYFVESAKILTSTY